MASLIGQHLGDYVLEAELGRGSMGTVYRARHATRDGAYAVKVLLDVLASDPSFITRFTREARVIASLRHPNIIRVYDTGRQGAHIFFTMEYFHGETAAQLVRARGRLSTRQVVEIAAQAADALEYAHSRGRVIHRDVKPENLLVDRWFRLKLLDFGLARIEGLRGITQAGTVVGSLYYVSPEQLLNRPLDGRTDVYALGVSMYEMLTGQRPYTGSTLTEMSDAILGAVVTPLGRIEPSVPPEVEHIVARAMARELSQRYASAGALAADLRELQASWQASWAAPDRQTHATLDPPRDPSEGATARQIDPMLPRSLRTTLRPASLQPMPPEQRETHRPRPPHPDPHPERPRD